MDRQADHLHLRRALDGVPASSAPPPGYVASCWHVRHARAVQELLVRAYVGGEGIVAPYELWLPAFVSDAEFDPESCFLLFDDRALAAVALCWRSAFIKDLCVAPEHRRRGLGSYLVARASAHFAARGAAWLELKVKTANASARRLYERAGFVPITSR